MSLTGLYLLNEAIKTADEINALRAKSGLKPLNVKDITSRIFDPQNSKDFSDFKNWKRPFIQDIKSELGAVRSATKAVPKGTVSGVVDEAAELLSKPAVGLGAGLEILRRRKNEVAAINENAENVKQAADVAKKGASLDAVKLGKEYLKGGGIIVGGIETALSFADAVQRAEESLSDKIAALPPRTDESYGPVQFPIGASPVGTGMGMPIAGAMPDMRASRMVIGEVMTDPKFYTDAAYNTINTLGGRILDRQSENYQKWKGNPFGQWVLAPAETVLTTPYYMAKDVSDPLVWSAEEAIKLGKNVFKSKEQQYKEENEFLGLSSGPERK